MAINLGVEWRDTIQELIMLTFENISWAVVVH